jgi:septum formation inhibitor-activating ATPase MinD
MAGEMRVPFLGRIPIEPLIVEASDNGKPFVHQYGKTPAAKAFAKVVKLILNNTENRKGVIRHADL